MNSFEIVRSQTMIARGRIASLVKANAAQADVIPTGWNNNLRWHLGHLIVTPRRLTSLPLGEPLGLPDAYNGWFAKGTGPRDWGADPVPGLDQLVAELELETTRVFDEMMPRLSQPFPKEYETSVGIVLRTPADALTMNYLHDGIHLGLVLALVRALKG